MELKRLVFFVVIFCVGGPGAFAQTFSTANGQWNVAGNWTPSGVPSGTGTDVTIGQNVNVSGGSYTIGNISVNNNKSVTVQSGGTLTLGSSTLYNPPSATTKKSLTFSNSGTLTVAGVLYIYGDLIVNNSLTLNITGEVHVLGDITMNNGGSLAVSGTGTLTVGGSLTGGNNTQVSTSGSGTIDVTGSISLGGGTSSISGSPGSISAGSCSCSGCSGSVCPNTVTPVELVSFRAEPVDSKVVLKWTTASEKNFDYFSVERSSLGMVFSEIAQVKGHGTSHERHDYSYTDENPFSGRSYYRLKSIDFDLYTETFNVISVNLKGGKNASVYPNPVVDGQLNVDLNFRAENDIKAYVTDLTGTELVKFNLKSANNTLLLDLKPGSYLIKISADDFSSVSRFVVH